MAPLYNHSTVVDFSWKTTKMHLYLDSKSGSFLNNLKADIKWLTRLFWVLRKLYLCCGRGSLNIENIALHFFFIFLKDTIQACTVPAIVLSMFMLSLIFVISVLSFWVKVNLCRFFFNCLFISVSCKQKCFKTVL